MAAGQGTQTEAVAGQGRPLTWWPAAVQPPWSKSQVPPLLPAAGRPLAADSLGPFQAWPRKRCQFLLGAPWAQQRLGRAWGRLAQRSGRDLCPRLPGAQLLPGSCSQTGQPSSPGRRRESRAAPAFNRPSPTLLPVGQTPPPPMDMGGVFTRSGTPKGPCSHSAPPDAPADLGEAQRMVQMLRGSPEL